MPYIAATATGFPEHFYSQETISDDLQMLWREYGVNLRRVAKIHENTTVEGRHIAVPKEEYYELRGWEEPNAIYARVAVELGQAVLEKAFDEAGLDTSDVALFAYASTTGLAIPTIDARLMNRLPFRPSTKRMPMFGLGCVAGAIGTSRIADYLKGHPTEAAVFLAEEFCSLTIQKHDVSIANLIACGLFGDGAGAVLMVGDEHPLAKAPRNGRAMPQVMATRSVFFPETEHFMGWEIKETGMQIVLSADVPDASRTLLSEHVESFLDEHEIGVGDVGRWICHPGGPKVIEAIEEGLGLNGTSLQRSRDVLREVGNVSSVSVLLILDEVMRETPPPGTWGLMMAMGPAFCAELVLLRW
jgi:alkylresorcinol/alkylpyrone synthase